MPSTAPAIYARNIFPARLPMAGRALALAVAGGCLAVLIVAARIEPDAGGFGSHTDLGFDPCQFEQNTGVPCITCGMTTSFAHFVRGQIGASFYVQPMGMALALTTAATFWGALYIAATARPVHRVLRFVPTKFFLLPVFGLSILAWIWKIWIHLTGRDGWGG